jgi:hypothetical protein
MYAMADREEDLKIGVKSSAILFAKFDRLIIVLLQLILMVNFPCGDRTVLRAFNQFINLSIRIIINHTAC